MRSTRYVLPEAEGDDAVKCSEDVRKPALEPDVVSPATSHAGCVPMGGTVSALVAVDLQIPAIAAKNEDPGDQRGEKTVVVSYKQYETVNHRAPR